MAVPGNVSPMPTAMPMMTTPAQTDDDDRDTCPQCGAQLPDGTETCPECGMKMPADDAPGMEAVLSGKSRNDLPDSAFLYIEPGGTKDKEGKTTPRSKRHFPVRNAEGKLDAAHVRNALARIPQSNLSADVKARALARARRYAKELGIKVSEMQQIADGGLLVEHTVAPVEITEVQDDGYHRVKFLVTTVGSRNRNGRIYPKELAMREVANPPKGNVLGQDGHPYGPAKLTDQFLVWEKMELEGDKEYAVAKVVPTEPDGKNFLMLVQAGAAVDSSRRGQGSVKEGEVNGVKGMVVQPEGYKLIGIDILYPDSQSDPNAHLVAYEALENENEMEITLETLRSEHADLVEAIESPLKEQVSAESAKLAEATAQLEAVNAKLQEVESKLAEATQKAEELNTALTEAQAAQAARAYLLDKAKGKRASWLVLDALKDCKSVEEVDAKFDSELARCDALIEHAITPAARMVDPAKVDAEGDKPNDAKPDAAEDELTKSANRIARISGF